MNSSRKIILRYLLQDLNEEEIFSYKKYIEGDKNSSMWIEKALNRREYLILSQTTCSICNNPININERGMCLCINNHTCYNEILQKFFYCI